MQNRFIAVCLLIALIGSGFSQFAVYAGFQLNQDYIAKNLCVNRNRPEMHCNGRCYLMSKLKQVTEKEKKQAARDNLNRMEISFLQRPQKIAFNPPVTASVVTSFPPYHYTYYSRYISTVFRPPKLLV